MSKRIFELHQVIVVNRAVSPLIQAFIQGGHAIGKAVYRYSWYMMQQTWQGAPGWQDQRPLLRNGVDLDTADGHPARLWRSVQNQAKLQELSEHLSANGVEHERVVEPDEGPLQGVLTAICTLPYEKEYLLARFEGKAFDLKVENLPAFKSEAVAYVVKQLQAQVTK